mmetsp:Transcript_12819/g.17493  ORF Transcript_12819/g.17493 Transcript_12819/m.17493 type:complete len:256 (+) Transcript_12819:577-1344(+)
MDVQLLVRATCDITPLLEFLCSCSSLNCLTLRTQYDRPYGLQLLNLSDDSLVYRPFHGISRRWQYLHTVSLRTCRQVTDEHICFLSQRALTHLDIGYCQLVTDVALSTLALRCPHLVTLKLGWCRFITDNGLIHIAERCSRLRFLEVKFCLLVGDAGLCQIAQKCVFLESLNCCCCREATDQLLVSLSQHSRHLLKLNIGYNPRITPMAITHLLSSITRLQALICVACTQITSESVSELKQRFPDVEINSAMFIM